MTKSVQVRDRNSVRRGEGRDPRGSGQFAVPSRGTSAGLCGVSPAVCGAQAADLLFAAVFPAGTGPPQAPADGDGRDVMVHDRGDQ
jgi:hypothetical protein